MKILRFFIGLAAAAYFAAATAGVASSAPSGTPLQHLIFIVQESRSFDQFFGTFPGADGIPANPPCQIDPLRPQACDRPYHSHKASDLGGPSAQPDENRDVDGGKMDGFVESAELLLKCTQKEVAKGCGLDVLGYHDASDLPNYWSYAKTYTLMDHFYESVQGWDLPSHLALFSGWSAECAQLDPPNIDSCQSNLSAQGWDPAGKDGAAVPYLWTDITYVLHQNNVSWAAFLDGGLGKPIGGPPGTVQGIDIPLGGFETVVDDGQYQNAVGNTVTDFVSEARAGTLPQVSWVIPNYFDSDHPQASIKRSQEYVTNLVNAVMSGPDWNSTAIFIVWDNMGGFYDHEPPPFALDSEGPGLRVPSILISPYAKQNFIDHTIYTTDSYLKLIEDVFANGESICQSGRPDLRPDCRDQSTQLGNLLNDFDFGQAPRRPLLLSPHPMTLLTP